MDEQLEHALEGTETCAPAGAMQASNRAEPGSWRVAAVHEKTAVQVPSPDPTPEEAAETGGEETEVKTESPTEEAKDASAAGLSAEEQKSDLPASVASWIHTHAEEADRSACTPDRYLRANPCPPPPDVLQPVPSIPHSSHDPLRPSPLRRTTARSPGREVVPL